MKKIIFILIFVSLTTNIFSQIKVYSGGNICIGPAVIPSAKMQIIGNSVFTATTSSITTAAYIHGANTYSTAQTPDYTWYNNGSTGIFRPSPGNAIGFSINGVEEMRIDNGYSGRVSVGAAGPYYNYQFTVNGTAFAYGGTWVPSDKRYKKNITPIEDALNKVLKLCGKSYEYKTDEYKTVHFNSGKNLGFIAQDLKDVLPEAVKEDSNGFYSMNYEMVIPVLAEAIKEQQKQIETLKTDLKNCCNKTENTTGENNATIQENSTQETKLYQNAPNPFNANTTIKCYIPQNVLEAKLCIYNMQGVQMKCINITERGDASVTIKGSELVAGIYPYVLITDGTASDTKQMILTK